MFCDLVPKAYIMTSEKSANEKLFHGLKKVNEHLKIVVRTVSKDKVQRELLFDSCVIAQRLNVAWMGNRSITCHQIVSTPSIKRLKLFEKYIFHFQNVQR